MRRLSLPLALFVLFALPSLAGNPYLAGATSLEPLIQSAAGIARTADAGLQGRASQRAVAIQTDFGHCCIGFGEAEVIAWNSAYTDPLGQLVAAWLASPDHAAILLNRDYTRIGCATAISGTRTYGVCILAGAISPAIPAPPVVSDTAMEKP